MRNGLATMAKDCLRISLVYLVEFTAIILFYSFKNVSAQASYFDAPKNIGEYNSFSSVSFLKYDVPELTTKAVWDARVEKKSSDCLNQTVNIVLQFGSYPVITPDNETFPEHFYVQRQYLRSLTVPSDNKTYQYHVSNPLAGQWYGVAYRMEQDNKVSLQGLSKECSYKLSMKFTSDVLLEVETITVGRKEVVDIKNSEIIRFHLDVMTSSFSVDIANCSDNAVSDRCPLLLFVRGQALPSSAEHDALKNCSASGGNYCSLSVHSPDVSGWQYILLYAVNGEVTFDLTVTSTACPYVNSSSDDKSKGCSLLPRLDRFDRNNVYKTAFSYAVNETYEENLISLEDNATTIVPFEMQPVTDIGGTLVAVISLNMSNMDPLIQNTSIEACLTKNAMPLSDSGLTCSNSSKILANTTEGSETGMLFVPYPEPGVWYVGLIRRCYNSSFVDNSVAAVPCVNSSAEVRLIVDIDPCVSGSCAGQGDCKIYSTGTMVFSACQCKAFYRGYGCTDGSVADSDAVQLTGLLLLTLSNLFFLPAIIVAVYRRFYIEGFAYTFTMFFSVFYHACDGNRVDRYTFCLMKYNPLGFGDFLGSVISLWLTLIAMTKIPQKLKPLLQTGAVLLISIGVTYDRTNVLVIVVPGAAALVFMLTSWIYQCKSRRHIFPSKRRWLIFIIPGILIAAAGFIMYAFFETDRNYKYIHSAWHVAISMCILFLLPSRPREKELGNDGSANPSYHRLEARNVEEQ